MKKGFFITFEGPDGSGKTTVSTAVAKRLQEKGIDTLAAALDRSAMTSDEARLDRDGVAVVIGNEGSGLSAEMIEACGKTVFIPISARSESLNASVASSIFLWEMRRRG